MSNVNVPSGKMVPVISRDLSTGLPGDRDAR